MEPAVLSALIIAGGSLVVALLTVRQNRKGAAATNVLSERVVDREDFDSVMSRMETALQRADKRVDDLEARLDIESEARRVADARAIAAEASAARAEERATILERRVTLLEQVLTSHDIPVPPLTLD